jgi:hypothetical protein
MIALRWPAIFEGDMIMSEKNGLLIVNMPFYN